MQTKVENSASKNLKQMVQNTLLELKIEVAKHTKAPFSNAWYGQKLIDEITFLQSTINIDHTIVDVFEKWNLELTKGPTKKIVQQFITDVKPFIFKGLTPAPLTSQIILEAATFLSARDIARLNGANRLCYRTTSPNFSRLHGVFFTRFEPKNPENFIQAVQSNEKLKITAIGYLMNQKNRIAYQVIGYENGTLAIYNFASSSWIQTINHNADDSAVVSIMQFDNSVNWTSQTQKGTIAVWDLSGQLINSYQKGHPDDVLTISSRGDVVSIPKEENIVNVNGVDTAKCADAIKTAHGHNLVIRASQELEFTLGVNNIAPSRTVLNNATALSSRGMVYLAKTPQFGGVDLHRKDSVLHFEKSHLGCILTNGNLVLIKRNPDPFYTSFRQLFLVDAHTGKMRPVYDSKISKSSHLYCSSLFTVLALPLNHFAVVTAKEYRFDDYPKPLPFKVYIYKEDRLVKKFKVNINEGLKDNPLHPKKVTALANGDLAVFTVEGPAFVLKISTAHQPAPVAEAGSTLTPK